MGCSAAWGAVGACCASRPQRPALLVTSCAMPGLLGRLTTNALRVLEIGRGSRFSTGRQLGRRPGRSQRTAGPA
ncbi:MAG: hypothetical protein R2864_05440 [Syntrophotaleaceae bacterium]